MTQTTSWNQMDTLPDDGKWRLFTHPDCDVPAIGRPIGPHSNIIENFWNQKSYFTSDRTKWAELP